MLPVNVQPCKVPPSQCLQCNLLNQAGSGPGALEKHGRRQGGDYNAVDAFFFFFLYKWDMWVWPDSFTDQNINSQVDFSTPKCANHHWVGSHHYTKGNWLGFSRGCYTWGTWPVDLKAQGPLPWSSPGTVLPTAVKEDNKFLKNTRCWWETGGAREHHLPHMHTLNLLPASHDVLGLLFMWLGCL